MSDQPQPRQPVREPPPAHIEEEPLRQPPYPDDGRDGEDEDDDTPAATWPRTDGSEPRPFGACSSWPPPTPPWNGSARSNEVIGLGWPTIEHGRAANPHAARLMP
jgi:hypothetical protein